MGLEVVELAETGAEDGVTREGLDFEVKLQEPKDKGDEDEASEVQAGNGEVLGIEEAIDKLG